MKQVITALTIGFLLATGAGAVTEENEKSIRAYWTEEPIVVDGIFDEDCWQKAQCIDDFWKAEYQKREPATQKTEVMVVYDSRNIYFGITCWDSWMDKIRATLTKRDKRIWEDDCIEIRLDTFHSHRDCYLLGINPIGTQMDIRYTGEGAVSDWNWDAYWHSKTHLYPDRWTLEVVIPFSSIRFSNKSTVWGANFSRHQQSSGDYWNWVETGASNENASRFGHITGIDPSRVLTETRINFLPYTTYKDVYGQKGEPKSGLDIILPTGPNLTTNITINPDFAQLESDPSIVNISEEREVWYPEKRPFFMEGAQLLRTPVNIFYSRRVKTIDFGLKTTGKIGKSDFALFDAYGSFVDRYDTSVMDSTDAFSHYEQVEHDANFVVARLSRDLGERSTWGFLAANKHETDGDATILSLDNRFVMPRGFELRWQYVRNFLHTWRRRYFEAKGKTEDWLCHRSRNAYNVHFEWSDPKGRGYSVWTRLQGVEKGFDPNETGFERDDFRTLILEAWRRRKDLTKLVRDYSIGTWQVYRTDSDGVLQDQYNELYGKAQIKLFNAGFWSGYNKRREAGRLWDDWYCAIWGRYNGVRIRTSLWTELATRRETPRRSYGLETSGGLFGKVTFEMKAQHHWWKDREKKTILRTIDRYQFTKRMDIKLVAERVFDHIADTEENTFQLIYSWEFLPKSHFYLVYLDRTGQPRAFFAKIAYMYELKWEHRAGRHGASPGDIEMVPELY
ncbi:MAG: carbohydrate binding family 9 domain-containing protein [Candidatus Latescibacteria bacterium]|nr:carbohydrate binding family 9 domain-containing protein [Candidatus Latescibacterota bacterium]